MSEQAPNGPEKSPRQLTDDIWNKLHRLADVAVASGYEQDVRHGYNYAGEIERTYYYLGEYGEYPEVDLCIVPEPRPIESSNGLWTPHVLGPRAYIDLYHTEEPEVFPEEDEDYDVDGNWIHQDKAIVKRLHTQYGVIVEDEPVEVPEYGIDYMHDKYVKKFIDEETYDNGEVLLGSERAINVVEREKALPLDALIQVNDMLDDLLLKVQSGPATS